MSGEENVEKTQKKLVVEAANENNPQSSSETTTSTMICQQTQTDSDQDNSHEAIDSKICGDAKLSVENVNVFYLENMKDHRVDKPSASCSSSNTFLSGGGRIGVSQNRKEEMVAQLVELGFEPRKAAVAIKRTGASSVERAANWLIDNDQVAQQIVDQHRGKDVNISVFIGNDGNLTKIDDDLTTSLAVSRIEYKMVFVVNTALEMGVGKVAAQVAHAVMGLCTEIISHEAEAAAETGILSSFRWEYGESAKKIVLKAKDEEELTELYNKSKRMDPVLLSFMVCDAGLTQIAAGSKTVVGIFGPIHRVDEVTGHLKLL